MDQAGAQSALDDIARIEARTAQAAVYGANSAILVLWGVVVALAYLTNQFLPALAGATWLCAWSSGFVGTALITWKWKRRSSGKRRMAMRLVLAQMVLILFGFLFLWLLRPSSPRQVAAFFPLVFMMGYVIAGLWMGRFFILCGILVSASTVIGYLYSGPWLPLWMAFANGGALIAGGLYLRKVGLRP
ncbi:MAG: hypothetical protein JF595_05725 [Sphingomonadales bacterium]|nr:hypothetical protein [Sphingomonadales bacterium]